MAAVTGLPPFGTDGRSKLDRAIDVPENTVRTPGFALIWK
jgi:hypothetical protein